MAAAILLLFTACGPGGGESSGGGTRTATAAVNAGTTGGPTYGGGVPGIIGSGTAAEGTSASRKETGSVKTATVKKGQNTQTKAAAPTATKTKTPPAVTTGGIAPASKTYRFTAPLLTGDKRRQLIQNPNRGLRLENYMSVENGQYTPELYEQDGRYKGNVGSQASGWLYKFVDDYAYESPQVVQTYFYLTQYRNKDLDQKAIDHMNAYFEACRTIGVTVALRFAYVFTMGCDATQDCVSLAQMQRHMQQLKPVLAKNRDVLFCLESGFFGQWGEQTPDCSWNRNGQVGAIIDSAVAMVPDDLFVLVRYAWVRDKASASLRSRIGYHNDYIVGVSHAWDSGTEWTSDTYQNLVAASARVLVEGEMPWGSQLPFDIDGWNVLKYLQTNHYTVLSCYHNNREGGVTYDMKEWRDIPVSAAALSGRGLRYYPAWFQDSSGKTISHSLFDYLQDFLGYHIAVSDATVKKDGVKAAATFSLTNYGFAAPLAMKRLRLVLLDEQGRIAAAQEIGKLADFQAGTKKDCTVVLPLPSATAVYRVGIFLEAPDGSGAKLANDLPMAGQVNVLGTMN